MFTRFPLGLENLEKLGGIFQSEKSWGILNRLENLGKLEGIFQSEKSWGILNRQEKSGKIVQNTGKNQGISDTC